MKAVEFQAQLNSDGILAIPASLLSTVPVGQTVSRDCSGPRERGRPGVGTTYSRGLRKGVR